MSRIRVKSAGPLLSLSLEDSEGIQSPRTFLVHNNRVTIIPLNYAKSIFNYPGAKEMFRSGKLIVLEGKELLVSTTEELGYEVPETVNHLEILNTLKGSNITRIGELFKGENKEVALQLASTNIDQLTQAAIGEIEKVTGLSLLVEN